MKKGIIEGFAAGIFIGIGGAVYLACENKAVGAVLFSVALLSICLTGMQLFTGKVGMMAYSHTKADFLSLLGCLIGNALGTLACALMVYVGRPALSSVASEMVAGKLTKTIPETFFAGILCGVLMYTAVWCYKNKNTTSAIFLCVPVFILAGFEHSIADMFYFFAALRFDIPTLIFIVTVVLGNTVGGLLIPVLYLLANPKKNA